MPTVREALVKISELRSRMAVLHEMVIYMETHYLSADSGPAELRITRDDHTIVPEEHIHVQIAHISEEMDQLSAELEEWEELGVSVGEDERRPAKKKRATKKGKARAAQGQRKNRPAPKPDEQAGGGQPS